MSVSYQPTFKSNRFYGLVEQEGPWAPAPIDKKRGDEMSSDGFTPLGVDTWSVVRTPMSIPSYKPEVDETLTKQFKNAKLWRKVVKHVGDRLIQKITTGFNSKSEPTLQEVGLQEFFKQDLSDALQGTMSLDDAKTVSEIVTDIGVTPTDADMILRGEDDYVTIYDPSPESMFYETVQQALSSFATPEQLEDSVRAAISAEQIPLNNEPLYESITRETVDSTPVSPRVAHLGGLKVEAVIAPKPKKSKPSMLKDVGKKLKKVKKVKKKGKIVKKTKRRGFKKA